MKAKTLLVRRQPLRRRQMRTVIISLFVIFGTIAILLGQLMLSPTRALDQLLPGTIVVAEQGTGSVLAFLPDETEEVLATGLQDPRGVAIENDGSVIVAEQTVGKIIRIAPGGGQETVVSGLDLPEGVAIDPGSGDIIVSTFGDGRLLRIAPDGSNVEELVQGLQGPTGVAVAGGVPGAALAASGMAQPGDIFVAEWFTGSLLLVSADGSSVTSITQQLANPDMIALAPDGLVYVANFSAGQLVAVDPETGELQVIADGLVGPVGVAVDPLTTSLEPDTLAQTQPFTILVTHNPGDGQDEVLRIDPQTGGSTRVADVDNGAGIAVVTQRLPSIVPEFNVSIEPEIKPPCGECRTSSGGIGLDPCPKCKRIGDQSPAQQDSGGRTVYLHSGEFIHSAVDLEIPGRGLNWRFERKYRSGITFDGPLGRNWDFNYNRRLVEVTAQNLAQAEKAVADAEVGDVVRMDGNSRVDLYARNPDGSFNAPVGFYTQLVKNPDGAFTERDYQGTKVSYSQPDADGVARMTSWADRQGNTIRFEYDAQGRLERVLDTLGRPITYHYNDQDRLAYVLDFNGRRVTFTYDDNGDLVEVTSPAVTDTPNGNDFPQGKTTRYAYSSDSSDPTLNHNLITITAPNEVAASGPPRIQVEYDGQDRVVGYTIGGANATGISAGGIITYTYTTLAAAWAAGLNSPVSETEVFDRNGNRAVYQFNSLGNIVTIREYTNRDVRPTEPAFYETSYEYNADGELRRQIYPEGNSVEYVYDETNPDRLQQGNLLTVIQTPDARRGGDQAFIKTTYAYEPIYNQVRTVIEPRGNDPSYVPRNGGTWSAERYTMIYIFDYEESCDFAAIGAQVGRTAAEVQQLLTAAGLCAAPLGDVNGDEVTDQINGNFIRTQYPTVNLLPGSNQALVEGDTAQEIVELYTYNSFGQVLSTTDPEGNVDVYAYYPERDPNGDGIIDNPAGDPDAGGYLKQVTGDTVNAAGRNSGTDPAPTNIRQVYAYDPVGNVTRTVDGRGIATDYVVNELNQVVQIVRAAAHDVPSTGSGHSFTPDPAELLALTDFQYLENVFYDANDNVIRRQVEDRGNTSNVGGDNVGSGTALRQDFGELSRAAQDTALVDYVYEYDVLDNRIQMTEEVSDTLDVVTRYRYDPNENLVLVIQPEGNATASVYDERDLSFQSTRGATAPPAMALLAAGDPTDYDVRGGLPSTMTYHYDGNLNLIETVDAADTDGSAANNHVLSVAEGSDLGGTGDRTRTIYDGFDRPTSVVDSVGNQTVYQYDPASNVVRAARFGMVGGSSPTTDGPDSLPMPISSDGVIQAANLVNANTSTGLSTGLLEATESLYDELNREFQTDRVLFVNTIPTVRSPDVADGASDIGKGDLTPDDNQGIPGISGVTIIGRVSTRAEYDRISRRTFTVEDDGDTTRTFYDGADRVIKTVDPEGNTVEYAYDDNHNLIETQETEVPQAASVSDEIFLTTHFYDSLNRLQRSVDNIGQMTDYRYDSRGNLVAVADAQGPLTGVTIARRAFTGGALTVNDVNDFGNVTLYSYDGLNRQTRVETVLTASGQGDGVNIGATLEGVKTTTPTPDPNQGGGDGSITVHYDWDRNSLLVSITDDNGNQTQYTYDNLDRRLTETKGVCVPPALADRCDPSTAITYEYDPDDNVVRLTDENGSIVNSQFDAINRRTASNVTRAPGVVGTTATSYEYDGLSRLTRATDDNEPGDASDDSTTTFAYDSLSRVVEETQQIGSLPAQAVSSAWRAENLRVHLTYPNDRALGHTYDDLDRLQAIQDESPFTPTPTPTPTPTSTPTPTVTHAVYLPIIVKGAISGGSQSVTGSADGEFVVATLRPGSGRASVASLVTTNETIAEYTYIGPGARLLKRTYANGVRLTYLDDAGTADVGYDGLRRPVRLRHLRSDDTLVVGFGHTYDRVNNKLGEGKLHDPANSEMYDYDSGYRLTHFDRPDANAIAPLHSDWTLDGVGNWQQVDGETRQHSSFNEIVERGDGGFTPILSDDNGNETDDGTYTFQWDYQNRLRRVSRKADGTQVAAYAYDAIGRRIRKVVTHSGALDRTTNFYYDGWQVLEERGEADALVQQYVYGIYVDEPLVLDRNLDGDDGATGLGDQRLFYHQNTLYSVFALTDQVGVIVEGYHYDAYGRQTAFGPGLNEVVDFGGDDVVTAGGGSALNSPYMHTGRRLDGETGLYYYRNRYLNTGQGRFVSRDPIGIWAVQANLGNGYSYVGNSGVNYIDPFGLDTWVGVGVQSGGFLFFGGVQTWIGVVGNPATNEKCKIMIVCFQIGGGLGGGGGVSVGISFNGPRQGSQLAGGSISSFGSASIGPGNLGAAVSTAGGGVSGGGAIGVGPSFGMSLSGGGQYCRTKVYGCWKPKWKPKRRPPPLPKDEPPPEPPAKRNPVTTESGGPPKPKPPLGPPPPIPLSPWLWEPPGFTVVLRKPRCQELPVTMWHEGWRIASTIIGSDGAVSRYKYTDPIIEKSQFRIGR